jgi:hypothetical protein
LQGNDALQHLPVLSNLRRAQDLVVSDNRGMRTFVAPALSDTTGYVRRCRLLNSAHPG